MPLLGQLRVFQAGYTVLEVGAGILHVRVEKERIEPAIEVVVRVNVLARLASGVVLVRAPGQVAPGADGKRRPGDVLEMGVLDNEQQEVVDRSGLDDQLAVGESFADLQLRVVRDGALGFFTGETHADGHAGAVAESVRRAACVDDLQGTVLNSAGEKARQHSVHRPVPGRCARVPLVRPDTPLRGRRNMSV